MELVTVGSLGAEDTRWAEDFVREDSVEAFLGRQKVVEELN